MLVGRLADVGAGHRSAERAREVGDRPRFSGWTGLLRVDRGDDEDVIAPHDRRAPAAAGHVDLPGDVLRSSLQRVGKPRVVRRDAGLRAAELRPVLRVNRCGAGSVVSIAAADSETTIDARVIRLRPAPGLSGPDCGAGACRRFTNQSLGGSGGPASRRIGGKCVAPQSAERGSCPVVSNPMPSSRH